MNQILYSHFIDPLSLRSNDFESFFRDRRAALLARIEEAMGKRMARDIPPKTPFTDPFEIQPYQEEADQA